MLILCVDLTFRGRLNWPTVEIIPNLNVGLILKSMRPNFIKLCMIITSCEFHRLSVTMTFTQGHRLSILGTLGCFSILGTNLIKIKFNMLITYTPEGFHFHQCHLSMSCSGGDDCCIMKFVRNLNIRLKM